MQNKDTAEILFYSSHKTPFGKALIACTEKALVHIALRPSNAPISSEYERLGYKPVQQETDMTATVKTQLDEYFAGNRKRFTVPLRLHGTEFQESVWKFVMDIPYGEVMSYGELASMANAPRAARAVGTTMAKNRIPVIVPCHRVVPVNRKLGNYTGGVDIKDQLLRIESVRI